MTTLARIQHIPNYIQQLRLTSGLYIGYVPQKYADLASNEDFYEHIANDSTVYANMHLLSLWVAGEHVRVKVADHVDPRVEQIVARSLSCLQDFTHSRKSLVYSGVLYGLGVLRKYWKKERFESDLVWDVPYELVEVDRRRLRIEYDASDRSQQYWTIWTPKEDLYMILEDRAEVPDVESGAAVQDFIWYWHEHQEDQPYGRGVGDVLFPLVYIKKLLTQYWADNCESWYKPWVTATLETMIGAVDASLGSGFSTWAERVTSYLDLLENMRARHVAVYPKNDEIRFQEGGSTGENIIQQFIAYIDSKIQLAIIGAELTTVAPSVGSYALGQIHRGATQAIIQYNRLRIAEVLARDLVFEFIIRNRKNFLALGIQPPKPYDVKIEIEVESEEVREQMMQQMMQQKQGGGMQGQGGMGMQ